MVVRICSTVHRMRAVAQSCRMACSRLTGAFMMEYMPINPISLSSRHIATDPPMAMTGMPFRAACLRTPAAVFPAAVWASIRPSPVMTRSAPSRSESNAMASSTISIPAVSLAFKKALKAPPNPPAAPAPLRGTMSVWNCPAITGQRNACRGPGLPRFEGSLLFGEQRHGQLRPVRKRGC